MAMHVTELTTRGCFVPRSGFCYVEADIAGLEGVTLAQCEIWTISNRTKADQINNGIDLLSVTGAAIHGSTYEHFMPRAKGVGMPKEAAYAHIRGLSKVAVYGKLDGRRIWTREDGTEVRAARTLEQAAGAMGIGWMTWDELREAIPPSYATFIGGFLLAAVQQRGAA